MGEAYQAPNQALVRKIDMLEKRLLKLERVAQTLHIYAPATSSLTNITTTPTQMPGCTITPGRVGMYEIKIICDFLFNVAGNATAIGSVTVTGGTLIAGQCLLLVAAGGVTTRATVANYGTWKCTDTSQAVNLVVNKNAAAATIDCVITQTCIAATWVAPA